MADERKNDAATTAAVLRLLREILEEQRRQTKLLLEIRKNLKGW